MDFEWNRDKAASNLKKHRIDFADAATVFDDLNTITVEDPGHDEFRFITIGMDAYGRLLCRVHVAWRKYPYNFRSKSYQTGAKILREQIMRKEYNFSKGKRGPVIEPDPNKVRITIRLDADIVDYFKAQVHKAGGGNYQTMINSVLRQHLDKKQAPMNEATLRRVIREELRATQ